MYALIHSRVPCLPEVVVESNTDDPQQNLQYVYCIQGQIIHIIIKLALTTRVCIDTLKAIRHTLHC